MNRPLAGRFLFTTRSHSKRRRAIAPAAHPERRANIEPLENRLLLTSLLTDTSFGDAGTARPAGTGKLNYLLLSEVAKSKVIALTSQYVVRMNADGSADQSFGA